MAKKHKIEPGDCFESIAFATGFFSESLWRHPDNAELREKRNSPHVLLPGDVVHIPDKAKKTETRQTDLVHRFVRRGVPSRFSVVLRREGEARGDVKYILRVGNRRYEGKTGPDGRVEHWIDPAARVARLFISEFEQYEFSLANLHPVEVEEGVRARLINLGYLDYDPELEKDEEAVEEAFQDAVLAFREDHELEMTQSFEDQAFRDKLREVHGS